MFILASVMSRQLFLLGQEHATGGVWLEATRNTKAVGGRGSKDTQLAVWKEETRNILKKIVFTADQGSLLQDIRNTETQVQIS